MQKCRSSWAVASNRKFFFVIHSLGQVALIMDMQQDCLEMRENLIKSPRAMGQIVALIATYNRKHLVCKCLEACLAQTEPPDRILLLDNGSTDGTKEHLQAAGFLKNRLISYFSIRTNIGPAGAFDQLIRLAWVSSNWDWIWVMDDDVVPTKSALQELKAAFSENFASPEKIGLLASVNVSGDWSANNVPEIDMRRPQGQEPIWGELLSGGLVRIRWSTLSSVLIPRSTIAKVGSVNPAFWGSGSDIDFTLRISEGAPIYLVGKSVAQHLRNVSGTFSVLTETDPIRIKSFFFHFRNNVYLRLKYYSFLKAILYMAKSIAEAVLALRAKKYPLLRARTVLLGTASGFVFRPTFKLIGPPALPMEQDVAPTAGSSLADATTCHSPGASARS
jgi:GT2 family glycosyltransferase